MNKDNWRTEIIKKLPWSATFLIASFSFFYFAKNDLAGWICLIIATIALFLVIKFDYYEKIIDRLEKQINISRKNEKDSHDTVTKTIGRICELTTGRYTSEASSQTETN